MEHPSAGNIYLFFYMKKGNQWQRFMEVFDGDGEDL
jgi:hypothetical protein